MGQLSSRQRRNGILNNELYLGWLIWNRQHFVKDPETGKRISRPNPEAEWITTEVPELRIIDDETWARVQELKRRYAGWVGNMRQTKKRLLSGLAVCACCGGSMTIARRDRYYCATRREKGTCDARHGIAVADLESRVLGGLQRLLVGNEALLDAFAEAFRQELARLHGSRRSNATKLRRKLAETERASPAALITSCRVTRRRPACGASCRSWRWRGHGSKRSSPGWKPTSPLGPSSSTRTCRSCTGGGWRNWRSCWRTKRRVRRRWKPSGA